MYGDDSLAADFDYHIFNWRSDGSNYGMSIDGVEQGVNGGADNGDWFGDNINLDTFVFSAHRTGGATSYEKTRDKESMFFNQQLSVEQRTGIINYLKIKHGL